MEHLKIKDPLYYEDPNTLTEGIYDIKEKVIMIKSPFFQGEFSEDFLIAFCSCLRLQTELSYTTIFEQLVVLGMSDWIDDFFKD